MESLSWLRWWLPESSYVTEWHRTLHIPCTNVSFLRLILSHNYVRCNYLGDIGEGYRGSFCIIFATPCESIIISKVKIKQIKQTKGGKKSGQSRKLSCGTGPGTASADPMGSSGAGWPFIIVSHEGKITWPFCPNTDHSVNVGRVLPLVEAALYRRGNP